MALALASSSGSSNQLIFVPFPNPSSPETSETTTTPFLLYIIWLNWLTPKEREPTTPPVFPTKESLSLPRSWWVERHQRYRGWYIQIDSKVTLFLMHLKLSEGEPVKTLLDGEHVGAMYIVNLYITVNIFRYIERQKCCSRIKTYQLFSSHLWLHLFAPGIWKTSTFVLHAVFLFLLGGGWLVGCLNASGNDSSTTETADVGTPSTSPERVGTCAKTRWAPEPIVLNVVISPPISGILPYL